MRNAKIRQAVEDISFELFSSAINLSIYLVVTGVAISTSGRSPSSVWSALEESARETGISKEALKRAFWKAQNRGLLKRKRTKGQEYWITTQQGMKKLTEELPTYLKHRPWDKKLYLVTYDIPEEMRYSRNRLREQLIKIGARQFQQSIYLILWDPTQVLRKFIREHDLKGLVIVSDTGTDGSIGEVDIDELVWKVFELEELNQRYKDFLTITRSETQKPVSLTFLYLSILRDDPQLPFELLGPNWLGDKAYNVFTKLTGSNAFESEIDSKKRKSLKTR